MISPFYCFHLLVAASAAQLLMLFVCFFFVVFQWILRWWTYFYCRRGPFSIHFICSTFAQRRRWDYVSKWWRTNLQRDHVGDDDSSHCESPALRCRWWVFCCFTVANDDDLPFTLEIDFDTLTPAHKLDVSLMGFFIKHPASLTLETAFLLLNQKLWFSLSSLLHSGLDLPTPSHVNYPYHSKN